MVVGIGIPRPVDLERAGGLAAIGVAQVRRDAAVLSLELLDRVERRAVVKPAIVEFNPPPAMSNNGKPEPASSIVDANGAFFVEGHGSSSLPSLLSKHARRCGHHRRRGARFQYLASDRIDHRRPPDI